MQRADLTHPLDEHDLSDAVRCPVTAGRLADEVLYLVPPTLRTLTLESPVLLLVENVARRQRRVLLGGMFRFCLTDPQHGGDRVIDGQSPVLLLELRHPQIGPDVGLGLRLDAGPVGHQGLEHTVAPRGDGQSGVYDRVPRGGGAALEGARWLVAALGRGIPEPGTPSGAPNPEVAQRLAAEGALHGHLLGTACATNDDSPER